MIKRVAKRIWNIARNEGFDSLLLKALHFNRLISVLHALDFFVKELGLVPNEFSSGFAQSDQGKVQMKEISQQELEKYDYAEGIYDLRTFRMHFSMGMRFFAAILDGKIVAVIAFNERFANLSYLKLPKIYLPKGFAYINCAVTTPIYRNLGVGSQLIEYLLNVMRCEGYQVAFSAVYPEDIRAKRWHSKNGFSCLGRIAYIKWHDRDFWWKQLTSVSKRYPGLLADLGSQDLTNRKSESQWETSSLFKEY